MLAHRFFTLGLFVALLLAGCVTHRSSYGPATKAAVTDASASGVAELQRPRSGVAAVSEPENGYDPVPPALVNALAALDYPRALGVAEAALSAAASPSPWLDYDRGEALAGLGRTDEAVAAFNAAEKRFRGDRRNPRGAWAALWGRARALAEAGRCSEARQAYAEYSALVRATASTAADMADALSAECRPLLSIH
jgi:tetratricopeptide (TPR) repeat protein